MLNVPMLRWGIQRVLRRHRTDLSTVADKTWTVFPEETVRVPRAVYLDGALEKIQALSPWRDERTEHELVHGSRICHAPSTAHLLRNVEVRGPCFYAGRLKWHCGFGRDSLWNSPARRAQRVRRASLSTTRWGGHYFGNLLLDDMPLGVLLQDDPDAVSTSTRPYAHEPEYRQLMGLPRAPLLSHARVGELTVFTDFAQNRGKAQRYREIRARLRQNPARQTPPVGVYIRRGRTGELRLLENEDEIERTLAALGFDILDPVQLSAQEIVRRSLDARIVAGVEGSHLSHVIYTVADNGSFLVLQPPDRFSLAYKEFADRLDMRFGFVVGDRSEGGFTVCPNELRALVDRLR